MARETIVKTVECNGKPTEVLMTKMLAPATQEELDAMSREEREDHAFQSPLNTRTYEPEPGIICMQDVPVKMRDGIKIYVDIYKPKDIPVVPPIVSWSFYGKRPFDGQAGWQIMGVPPQTVSNMSKFESPTPATGAVTATPSPTSTRAAWATPRVTSCSSVPRRARTATTSLSGPRSRPGATAMWPWPATPAWP